MSKFVTINEVTQYIAELNRIYKAGNATEHTYRPALKTLLEKITTGLTVTNEPKRIACGAPDYIVTRKEIPVGYIEAKDIDADLKSKANKIQFDRYKQSLNNLIITDYLTFQLFENSRDVINHVSTVRIAKTGKNGIEADKTQFEAFLALINLFTDYDGQGIQTSVHLSKVMAAKARLMANIIENALNEDNDGRDVINHVTTNISEQLKGFREVLIHDITHKEFADIYAQTIAYGMFAAKLNDTSPTPSKGGEHSPPFGEGKVGIFTRNKAAQFIPHSNPFLRKLFQYIAGYDLDERICWAVDDLADLFNYVDINAIIKEFGETDHDPIIHFYETFLAEYDPALRKSRGVWYTPQPVVQFIVQAVDDILKRDFELSQGLADTSFTTPPLLERAGGKLHRVQILDPATGTGTFLAEVVKNIYQRFKNQQGIWQGYVHEHLIPRINGFEILMASYAMAHLKLDMLLQQTGYTYSNPSKEGEYGQRLRIYLTNSLEEARAKTEIPFTRWLAEEANEANHIKQDVPIMVVLGNPPYSGISQNNGKWITDLIENYKYVNGVHFNERKHWLQDDYVKFIRYGQYFIDKNGEGIVAFINNHGFLDNPTFRGMRWSLLKSFDKIYILDLHGNAKKKETAPDGSKDENVFDIQQGVSINIFVKTHKINKKTNPLADVYHADLYGKRTEKYSFLSNNNLKTVKWKKIEYKKPFFFFVPKSKENKDDYDKGFAVNELFNLNVTGIVTARDSLVIDADKKTLQNRIQKFCDKNIGDDEIRRWLFPNKTDGKYFAGDTRGWKLTEARKKIRNNNHDEFIIDINYRPFDIRKIYYSPDMVDWGRKNVMQHFFKNGNMGLVVARQAITNNWGHVQVSKAIIDNRIHYSNKGTPILMPLYLYPETKQIFFKTKERKPNLNQTIINEIAQSISLQFTEEKEDTENTFAPIDVLDYIYAVLHSPAYRERYKEFLKIDFPRVPYPENAEQFWKLVKIGGKLRCLHLMENIDPQEGIANYPIVGSNEVEKLQYILPNSSKEEGLDGRVYINDTQYFDHVPTQAWNFYIGGYQPAQKWMKDRKRRTLSFEDIRHYQKIIRVLKETEEMMRDIDKIKESNK